MIYVFLANGFEEIEAIAPIDLLRRAGKEVVTVGIGGQVISGAHGIPVTADIEDTALHDFAGTELIVLPGGMPGTRNEEASDTVQAALDYCVTNGVHISAICAAPSILGHKGLLEGKRATCYAGFESHLTGAEVTGSGVVTDGTITTGRGPGVAVDFALELISVLCGKEKSLEIRRGLLCDDEA